MSCKNCNKCPVSSCRKLFFIAAIFIFVLSMLAIASFVHVPVTPIAPTKEEAQKKFLNIQVVTSDSGIKAWLVEDHSLPIIAMNYSFRGAGSKNEPSDKQGLARLASNTMDEGAGDIDSQTFQKMLNDHSITLRFNTSRDHYGGVLKTLTKYKDTAFDLLHIALTEPRFDEEPLERMRNANKSRIRSSLSNPNWLAARLLNDRIYEDHAYAMNSGGTLSSLEKISADDLRQFHKTLGKNQLVIGVTGDITADELRQRLDGIFGELPDVERIEPEKHPLQNAGKAYLYKQNIPQTIIKIAQPGISRQDEDFYSAYLMNFILGASGFGSRLMEEIREKRGLTYGIYSYFQQYEEIDTLNISTSTANDNVEKMLSLIREQWTKMSTDGVSEEELRQAKAYLIGSLPLSLTSTDSISGILLSLQLDHLPIDHLDTRAKKIDAVSVDDIKAISKRLLDTEKITTIMVGSPPSLTASAIGDHEVSEITKLPNVE